ncbi:MAG: TetR/AcrR family transcriptional regulator [Bacteroidota bacterium]
MKERQRILLQAENMFLRYGIKSVTMDDIARDLGISKKTLYQYVSNKADLIQKIFDQHVEMEKQVIDEVTNQSKDAIDEILNIAKTVIQMLRGMSPNTIYDLRKYYRDIWMMMEALHQKYIYQVIKTNLERGKKEGLYREDLHADIVAKLYVAKNSLVVDEELFPLREYNKEKLFSEYINYHIHGIASAKGLKLLEKYTSASC